MLPLWNLYLYLALGPLVVCPLDVLLLLQRKDYLDCNIRLVSRVTKQGEKVFRDSDAWHQVAAIYKISIRRLPACYGP
jgi:hypothetical protein